MGPARPTTYSEQYHDTGVSLNDRDRAAQQRLAILLEANETISRQRSLYRTDWERIEASLMTSPIDSKKAFSHFGFMIGIMPPATVAIRAMEGASPGESFAVVFIVLLLLASVATGIAGFFVGKSVPAAIDSVRSFRLPNRLAMFAVIGMVWGAGAGAVGGFFLLVVGSIFAGLAGAIVGAFTVPLMAIAYEALRLGDRMEMKHFLPVAFGITLSVCALIIGL